MATPMPLLPESPLLCSTMPFAAVGLREALEGIRGAGYRHVEICAVKGWYEHLDPETVVDRQLAAIADLLGALELTCPALSAHSALHTPAGVARFERALDAAAALGARVVTTFTGASRTAAERAAVLANLPRLADRAADLGLVIGLETDSTMLPSAAPGLAMLAQLGDHPGLGMTFDTGNVVYYAGIDPVDDVRQALPAMAHLHLKDKRGGPGVFDFPPLGDGELDLAAVLAACDAGGYHGAVCVEINFDEDGFPAYDACIDAVRRSREHLLAVGLRPDA
jgi:sugar phosphate isomerase/epimerase